MTKRIVVVGSINMDLVVNAARRPDEGETVSGTGFAMFPGGKGANQAVAAARLGGDVVMVGRLGRDIFANQLRDGLEAAGVTTRCVAAVDGASGVAAITVTEHGGNSILVVPGANGTFLPTDLETYLEEFRDATILLAQLEIPMETVERLAEICEELSIPFLLDPAPAQLLSPGLMSKVSWLTPNESEAGSLLKSLGEDFGAGTLEEAALERAATRLLATGVRNVALKLGEGGVYVSGKDIAPALLPAFAVKAVDTTAAGDAFNGGLAYALAEGMAPDTACEFAVAVAAVSVTRVGAQPSMPWIDEVREMLALRTRKSGG